MSNMIEGFGLGLESGFGSGLEVAQLEVSARFSHDVLTQRNCYNKRVCFVALCDQKMLLLMIRNITAMYFWTGLMSNMHNFAKHFSWPYALRGGRGGGKTLWTGWS